MKAFKRKPLPNDRSASSIRVHIVMTDGRDVVRNVSEREFADARYDLGRRNPNPDSRIFIADIIAHPADFQTIERA